MRACMGVCASSHQSGGTFKDMRAAAFASSSTSSATTSTNITITAVSVQLLFAAAILVHCTFPPSIYL